MAPRWVQVGYTFYNDPPPGAGNLAWGGYSFAELGTATRGGQLTGRGNLGSAMGLSGEEPMGSEWSLYAGHQVVIARKQDRGYGQGGDGTYSDPRYAIDLYDGRAHGLPDLVAALGAGSSGALWIMRGRWHPPMAVPAGGAQLPAGGPLTTGAPPTGPDPGGAIHEHDYSRKVQESGRRQSQHGATIQRVNAALSSIPGRYRR